VRCGIALLAASLVAAPVAMADGVRGEALIRGGGGADLRYTVVATHCADRLATEWWRPDGSLAASEEVELTDGRWSRYRLRRANLGQDLRAERRGDIITITDAAAASGRPTARLTARGTVLAGPELVSFLQDRLEALRAGRALEFQYLLADRGTALGFIARGRAQGADTTVALEASSAWFRPFVPTTTFRFAADGGLREVVGRMLPVMGDPRSPKPLDGVLQMGASQSTCNRKSLS
jgi:hypothetical protein